MKQITSMDKIKYTLRFNRKKQLNKEGLAPIQIECYQNGKRKYFDTKIKVSPSHWNEKTKTIKGTPTAIQQNKHISELVRSLENYELQKLNEGKYFSLDMLDEVFKNPKYTSFNDFMRVCIENSNNRYSTKRGHFYSLGVLNQFNKNLSFSEINFEFLKEYEKYLKQRRKGGNPIKINSVNRHFAILKTYVKLAINNDFINISQDPFRKFKAQTEKTEKTFLLPNEIEELESLKIDCPRLDYCRDLFLFSVYTGLRYGDIMDLNKMNIVTIEGKEWLIKEMQKTKEKVKIPIYLLFNGKALNIIKKYWSLDFYNCFKYIHNITLNKSIVSIMDMLNINKKITFHCARHTTATYLLYKGVSIFVVKNMLGHTQIQTTQIYSHLIDQTIINELESVNF